MGMPTAGTRWTAAMVRELPDDGRRYELVDGRLLVTPSPRGLHQVAVGELHVLLHGFLSATGFAHVLGSPADLSLGEDEVLQPDLFVYRTASGRSLRDWSDITSLLLVVEVLSPSTARYDRQLKRRRYQRAAVAEYWIVDPDARLIERWRPDDTRPEIVVDRLVWWESADAAAFELDVAAYFAKVWGETG
jgi:Uma2 family endonuclease